MHGDEWREQRTSAGGGWPRLWRGTGDAVVLAHRRPPAVASRGERLRRRGLPGPGQGVGNDMGSDQTSSQQAPQHEWRMQQRRQGRGGRRSAG